MKIQSQSGQSEYGESYKIFNTFLFLFSNEILVFRTGIHKMLVRIENREDPDQTLKKQSDLGLPCLSSLFSRQLVFKIVITLRPDGLSQALIEPAQLQRLATIDPDKDIL